MTTIREVAVQAGVSVATVSRALSGNGRVSARTRELVREVAVELGYQPDDVAQSLVGGGTRTLAMVVPDITNPFFPELVAGVQQVADARRHALWLLQSGDDPARAAGLLLELRRRRVSGVVLVGGTLPADQVRDALREVPLVTVDRVVPLADVPVVTSDHREGGRLAGRHLLGLGHERIAHVGGPAHLDVSAARRQGLDDAMQEAGTELDPDLVVDGDFLEESGYHAVTDLLARRKDFSAVVAANDLMAIGALRALDEAGRAVPEEVSVVGYDDIHLARYVRPGLTTVRQDVGELGRRAVQLLLDRPAPALTVLPVELVRRGTTAPHRGRTAGAR
jgi:DNA-binding LacI/PurR family transcriptional regulator